MGYVKNAIATVHDEGCLWLEDSIVKSIRDAGLKPKTRSLVIKGFAGPVELDAITADEARRIIPLLEDESLAAVEEALRELEDWG